MHSICIALHCIFLCGFACFSCLSPIFLVSRLNRHDGDSLLSFLSFFLWLFTPVFGVLSRVSSSDHLLIVNLISNRCTRALAVYMDDHETRDRYSGDSTGDTRLRLSYLAFSSLGFCILCLPCAFALPICLLACLDSPQATQWRLC